MLSLTGVCTKLGSVITLACNRALSYGGAESHCMRGSQQERGRSKGHSQRSALCLVNVLIGLYLRESAVDPRHVKPLIL